MRSLRSSYADNARSVRGISVFVRENVAAIAFIDRFPLTIRRHMAHVARMFRAWFALGSRMFHANPCLCVPMRGFLVICA